MVQDFRRRSSVAISELHIQAKVSCCLLLALCENVRRILRLGPLDRGVLIFTVRLRSNQALAIKHLLKHEKFYICCSLKSQTVQYALYHKNNPKASTIRLSCFFCY